MKNEDLGPRIPIPGAAGEAIRAALQKVSTHCGPIGVRIDKERVPGGGYIFTVSVIQPPVKPVT